FVLINPLENPLRALGFVAVGLILFFYFAIPVFRNFKEGFYFAWRMSGVLHPFVVVATKDLERFKKSRAFTRESFRFAYIGPTKAKLYALFFFIVVAICWSFVFIELQSL